MGCAFNQNQHGFTLVEIAIVMIIIGLLIGGTFGGMMLIENMQINRTVQDFKAIESASLTFRDTYGRLPGDIVNPASRIPNCTVAPCSMSGDGNRTIGQSGLNFDALPAPSISTENVSFWSHLRSSDLTSFDMNGSNSVAFGSAQPQSANNAGLRISNFSNYTFCPRNNLMHVAILTNFPDQAIPFEEFTECSLTRGVDNKMDDGAPLSGKIVSTGCSTAPLNCNATYNLAGERFGGLAYDLQGF